MSSSGFNLQNVASTSLFVGDLSPSVNETTLYTIFNTVGPVASIKICRDVQTRNSLGYGYVNYHSLSDAEKAIKELNYSLIEGTPCRIMWSQRDPSIRMKNDSNLYIRNIEKSIETKDLHNAFYKFGTILSCKIATDVNGKSLGYGFVHYANAEAATKAIKEMNGYKLGNKCIEVMLFLNREKKGDGKAKNFTNIYVKDFNPSWTEKELRSVFEKMGTITSLYYSVDHLSRPFACINFESHEAAKKSIDELHGKFCDELISKEVEDNKTESETFAKDVLQIESASTNEISNGNVSSTEAKVSDSKETSSNSASEKKESIYSEKLAENNLASSSSIDDATDEDQTITRNNYESTKNVLQKVRSDKDNKKWFGEQLFPLVFNYQPDLAAKLTGMLLELNDIELKKLIIHDIALREKINEALAVLNDAKNRA
uniref:Polyadenylate-binding protein, cytoplasmic and nuclear-like n=1 Tax=Dermatophagoides pteronyssinus TaxID=6956 RepID=A0A6P6XKB7_DERPT|nr:polyadenylate-binding protein, cytoplasmic and nuclear-like [Dermatophagoides pteronyssinus]